MDPEGLLSGRDPDVGDLVALGVLLELPLLVLGGVEDLAGLLSGVWSAQPRDAVFQNLQTPSTM